ncbi:MAG: amidohydrolase family protein [Anaerolineae bacterium]|nr:amidohydrolase family protein [Anaerolineae bacterium]
MTEEMLLRDFQPRPALVVPAHQVPRPRFPAIDAHSHLGKTFGVVEPAMPPAELIARMDAVNVSAVVDLDGGWGEEILHQRLDSFKAAAPERFACFGGVAWERWAEHPQDFGEWAADRLEAQVRRGAQGLKVWKNLGLKVRDAQARLVPVDDPRLDPLWARAGELGVPVLIHIADPVAFFWPLDGRNERYEELRAFPDWHFYGPEYPPFEALVEGMANVVRRHPRTTFIGAHVGCYPENLGWVGALLDEAPNFHVDIAARVAELGRQPYSARRFFLEHADRILFGTDLIPGSYPLYEVHFRFLETWDEHFAYSGDEEKPGGQGRWRIHGLGLPDDVLEKVYYRNAARLLGFQEACHMGV